MHFLQIWILPEQAGLLPSYGQRAFSAKEKRKQLLLVASRDGREQSVPIHQDVSVYATLLAASDQVQHPLVTGRHAWVHIVRGTVSLNGVPLLAGDGAAVRDEESLLLNAREEAEILLFDLT